MSAQIYADIRAAVSAYYPEHLDAFKLCRTRDEIIAFMDEHFPLPASDNSWAMQLLTRIPTLLRQRKEAEKVNE